MLLHVKRTPLSRVACQVGTKSLPRIRLAGVRWQFWCVHIGDKKCLFRIFILDMYIGDL